MGTMSANNKSIYQNLLDLTREINKAILLQTNSEPFDHKEYLQAVLEPLLTNEDVIRSIRDTRLNLVMEYFLINPKNKIQLYLNQNGFDDLYDVLKNKKPHPNLQLILDKEIDQKKAINLFGIADLVDLKKDSSKLPSFGIINNAHTLTYNEEEGGFLIHFNPKSTTEGKKHFDLREDVFKMLTDIAEAPLKPRWIRSNILTPDQISSRTKD